MASPHLEASPRTWSLVETQIGVVEIVAADGVVVSRAEMEDESWEEDVANARLIVAAVNAFQASGREATYPPMWERNAAGELVEIQPEGGA